MGEREGLEGTMTGGAGHLWGAGIPSHTQNWIRMSGEEAMSRSVPRAVVMDRAHLRNSLRLANEGPTIKNICQSKQGSVP